VFICCEGCRERLLKESDKYLAKLAALQSSGNLPDATEMDLPPIGVPQLIEPDNELPQNELPHSELPPIEAPQEINDSAKENTEATLNSLKRLPEQPTEAVR
ncbi:MAG: hypothetical protein ACE1ZA_12560, partial [Pseudomonadales bacterium]